MITPTPSVAYLRKGSFLITGLAQCQWVGTSARHTLGKGGSATMQPLHPD